MLKEKIKKLVGITSFKEKAEEFGFKEVDDDASKEFLAMNIFNFTGKVNSKVFRKNEFLVAEHKYYTNAETIFPKVDLVVFKRKVIKTPYIFALSNPFSAKYNVSYKSEQVKALELVKLDSSKTVVLSKSKINVPTWCSTLNFGSLSVELTENGLCISMPSYYDFETAFKQFKEVESVIDKTDY